MANSLKTHIENLLKTDERLIDENNEIRGNLIRELANKLDERLIELLLNDENARKTFFLMINEVYVFKHNDFKFFLDENKIDNSYTQYENRIGLALGSKMLNENQDVVLNFPYKDCVLEGGQSTEEGMDTYFEFREEKAEYEEKQAKRKEIFFNEILARDEIDRLFEPKAFTNIKKYSQKGEAIPTTFTRDENGVIKDNLIIKGNNLLALHSLTKQFNKQVKLIYIDPPFNTGKDEFKYNDSFNHSTWLTFMKNRLESAKLLLQNEGVICVHVGNEEASYVQILLNEIFKKENYLNHITMTTNAASGFKATSAKIFSTSNHIFLYANNINECNLNKIYVPKEYDENYKYFLTNSKEHFSKWKYTTVIEELAKREEIGDIKSFKLKYSDAELQSKIKEFAEQNKENVFRTAAVGGGALKKRKSTIEKSKSEKGKVMQHLDEDVDGFYILNGEQIVFWGNTYKEINGLKVPATSLTDVWTDIGFTGIANEGGVTLKNGKKPEQLLKRIIDLTTLPNDILLDYHLGSGTTVAVAHKMKRQYIGIEQLDYYENDSLIRLKNVTKADTTGISKTVNWKGGGSFVYLELAKNNEQAKELILDCGSFQELVNLFDVLYEEFFLHYNVKIKEFKEKISKEANFIKLTLLKQKEMFCKMLDLNQMYVNASEMEDSRYKLSPSDISLTKDFYQIKD